MEILTGKKLLILGGSAYMVDPVLTAKKMGVYTIVTDMHGYDKCPAKRIADEYWDISLMDFDKLVPLINNNNVNGILTGFTDAFLMPYQHLCELTGLPCYATKEVFEMTMDKAKFKNLCRDSGVPVIPEYILEDFDPTTISSSNKIIIKPVDNSGSHGVTLCENSDDFSRCLEYALSFSAKKQVIIEKYMEMDSISVSYTVQDGVISLSTTDDRYVHKSKNGSSVTHCGVYPSKYTDSYIEQLDLKVRKMFEKAGLRNGVLAMQFFTNGKVFYAMEMGHRLSGGQHYTYTYAENGISALEQLIRFSVTGKMANFSIAQKDNARFKHVYCHLFILCKEAQIARFEGIEHLQQLPEILKISQMKNVGDMVGRDGTSEQKVMGLHLRVDDVSHLKRLLGDIEHRVHIYDENGDDLIIHFNLEDL